MYVKVIDTQNITAFKPGDTIWIDRSVCDYKSISVSPGTEVDLKEDFYILPISKDYNKNISLFMEPEDRTWEITSRNKSFTIGILDEDNIHSYVELDTILLPFLVPNSSTLSNDWDII